MLTDHAPMSAAAQEKRLFRLKEQYPFVYTRTLTVTGGGRKVFALQLGQGGKKILLAAGHHANEYITAQLLWQMLERYCHALKTNDAFGGRNAAELYYAATLYLVPMVNPDGVDLVTGAIASDSEEYRAAEAIARQYPEIDFPFGWKANLRGVDLNLNYPAGWEQAKKIKAAAGFSAPAPRDYPGSRPLDQPETAALAAYTCCVHPDLVLAYHTQGGEIYYEFGGVTLPQSEPLAQKFAVCSGYRAAHVPPESANAGFKDWFLSRFRRPGFTVEAGRGQNPLPLRQLEQLVRENIPLLVCAMTQ